MQEHLRIKTLSPEERACGIGGAGEWEGHRSSGEMHAPVPQPAPGAVGPAWDAVTWRRRTEWGVERGSKCAGGGNTAKAPGRRRRRRKGTRAAARTQRGGGVGARATAPPHSTKRLESWKVYLSRHQRKTLPISGLPELVRAADGKPAIEFACPYLGNVWSYRSK